MTKVFLYCFCSPIEAREAQASRERLQTQLVQGNLLALENQKLEATHRPSFAGFQRPLSQIGAAGIPVIFSPSKVQEETKDPTISEEARRFKIFESDMVRSNFFHSKYDNISLETKIYMTEHIDIEEQLRNRKLR